MPICAGPRSTSAWPNERAGVNENVGHDASAAAGSVFRVRVLRVVCAAGADDAGERLQSIECRCLLHLRRSPIGCVLRNGLTNHVRLRSSKRGAEMSDRTFCVWIETKTNGMSECPTSA